MTQERGHKPRPRFDEPAVTRLKGFVAYREAFARMLRAIWLPGLVFVVVMIYHWPTLGQGFVADDFAYMPIFKYAVGDYIEAMAKIHSGVMEFPFFRPVTFCSFRIDYLIWGVDPVGFHLSNIVLHSLNAILLFYLARSLGFGKIGAVGASLLFGLWPTNPEAVTWVSGRFDIQSLNWLIVAFLLWIAGRWRNDGRYLGVSAIAFFIALMCKEIAAAGVLALPLVDWVLHVRSRREWGYGVGFRWQWYVAYLAVVVCVVAFRFWLFGDVGGYTDENFSPVYFGKSLNVLCANLAGDLWMMITPLNRVLWAEWSYGWQATFVVAGILAGVGLVVGLFIAIKDARRGDGLPIVQIAVSVIWILVMLLPVLPIQAVQENLRFSRFLYIGSAGLAMWFGVALGAGMRGGSLWKIVTVLLMVGVLFVAGNGLRRNNVAWMEAGELAGIMHTTMAAHIVDLPEGASIFMVNTPWLHKGAQCVPHNPENYVLFEQGTEGIRSHRVDMEHGEVDEWWESIRSNWSRPGAGFEWIGSERRMRVLGTFWVEE